MQYPYWIQYFVPKNICYLSITFCIWNTIIWDNMIFDICWISDTLEFSKNSEYSTHSSTHPLLQCFQLYFTHTILDQYYLCIDNWTFIVAFSIYQSSNAMWGKRLGCIFWLVLLATAAFGKIEKGRLQSTTYRIF